jgi:nucleoid DNA-binding protein
MLKMNKRTPNAKAGFKYHLTLELMKIELTRREADSLIDSIFDCIRAAIRANEVVNVEGFGVWHSIPVPYRRAWKFGRVIQRPPRMVQFVSAPELDKAVTNAVVNLSRKIKRKAEQPNQTQRDTGVDSSSARYAQVIRHFLVHELQIENHSLFWAMVDSPWAKNALEIGRHETRSKLSVVHAQQAIDETRPRSLPSQSSNLSIELACWYARWVSRLDIDPAVWRDAEYEVRQWGAFRRL